VIRAALVLAVLASVAAPSAQHRFTGKLELVPLFKHHQPILRNGHSYYAVRDRITFRTDGGEVLTVHAGQTTDLASIPRFLWPILPPDGPWAEAAVFHDTCYRTRGAFTFRGREGRSWAGPGSRPYTRAECDEVLRQAMVALGVGSAPRVTIWAAVRAFGGQGWGS
jgi:hypothetical protein